MDELVKKLSDGTHSVEAARPEKTAKALKESIDRKYVHIMFKETGTELGTQLDLTNCDFEGSDFENGKGKIHIEGGLTLNYDKVRVVADIDLKTLDGTGHLALVDDTEYDGIMNSSQN